MKVSYEYPVTQYVTQLNIGNMLIIDGVPHTLVYTIHSECGLLRMNKGCFSIIKVLPSTTEMFEYLKGVKTPTPIRVHIEAETTLVVKPSVGNEYKYIPSK